jgi:hypothetical protein
MSGWGGGLGSCVTEWLKWCHECHEWLVGVVRYWFYWGMSGEIRDSGVS